MVVVRHSHAFGTEETEDWLRGNGGHVTALMIEPLSVALFRNPVADEDEARGTQGDQFIGVDRQVARGLRAELALEAPYFMKFPAIQ